MRLENNRKKLTETTPDGPQKGKQDKSFGDQAKKNVSLAKTKQVRILGGTCSSLAGSKERRQCKKGEKGENHRQNEIKRRTDKSENLQLWAGAQRSVHPPLGTSHVGGVLHQEG